MFHGGPVGVPYDPLGSSVPDPNELDPQTRKWFFRFLIGLGVVSVICIIWLGVR